MQSLTVDSVMAELKQAESYEDTLKVGARVKQMVTANKNTPFLPMDVYEQIADRDKARSFMLGVICS